MIAKLNIGILFTQEVDLFPYINLLSKYGKVNLVLPTELSSKVDLLVIPDIVVSPIIPSFIVNNNVQLPAKAICPSGELFRTIALPWYLDSRCHVLAIGQSMCMLHTGKCTVYKGMQRCIPVETSEIQQETEDFLLEYFEDYRNLDSKKYGVLNLNSTKIPNILRELTRIINGDGMDIVKKPTGPMPPPVILRNAATKNKPDDRDSDQGPSIKGIN